MYVENVHVEKASYAKLISAGRQMSFKHKQAAQLETAAWVDQEYTPSWEQKNKKIRQLSKSHVKTCITGYSG